MRRHAGEVPGEEIPLVLSPGHDPKEPGGARGETPGELRPRDMGSEAPADPRPDGQVEDQGGPPEGKKGQQNEGDRADSSGREGAQAAPGDRGGGGEQEQVVREPDAPEERGEGEPTDVAPPLEASDGPEDRAEEGHVQRVDLGKDALAPSA